jgi:hypothetical protein
MGVGLDQMRALVGRRFPGGTYLVQHWEQVLLADVVEHPADPAGIVHPIGLFHVPLAACGWSYAEIFEICHAESAEAVRAGEYRWELHRPLVEDVVYDVAGEFVGVERKHGRRGGTFDKVTFQMRLTEHGTGAPAATVTNSWLFLRSDA